MKITSHQKEFQKIKTAMLSPTIRSYIWIMPDYANQLFDIQPPIRSKMDNESDSEFVNFFIDKLTCWIETEKHRDFAPILTKFLQTFQID
jgi:hypothetical protein